MYSLRVAFGHIRAAAKEQGLSFWAFLRRGRDPTTTAVFAEDAGAVAGLAIAGEPGNELVNQLDPTIVVEQSVWTMSLTQGPRRTALG